MVTSTCYIRLNDYQSATNILEKVLARSPQNHKALYSLAFCRRAIGSQREAIEGLTKVYYIPTYKHKQFLSHTCCNR